jgi:hypothetical protein
MNELDQARRSLFLSLAALSAAPGVTPGLSRASPAAPRGYVLDTWQGEHLIHFRDGGDIEVDLSPFTGASRGGTE